jgi:hypothetical protein
MLCELFVKKSIFLKRHPMSIFAPLEFSVLCPDAESRPALVSFLRWNRHAPADHPGPASLTIDSRDYLVFLDADKPPLLLVVFSRAPPPAAAAGRPLVYVCVGGPACAPRASGDLAVFHHESLAPPVLHSVFSYAALLNDCHPLGLHLRADLSALALTCLRRVFRSLDADFDARVSFADLSAFHGAAFGAPLSAVDLLAIFRVMAGADPRDPGRLGGASFTFAQFAALARALVLHGDGHAVFRLIAASPFHRYLAPGRAPALGGAPAALSAGCQTFIRGLYEELEEAPSGAQVLALFALQGRPPTRVTNMRSFDLSEWARVWADWCAAEPAQAARNLLAFGFPPEKLDEAFGVAPPPRAAPLAAVAAAAGVAALALAARLMRTKP